MLTPGTADGLGALEIGAIYRLVRFAWRQQPPCTVPADDASLAMVAGVTSEEWLRIRPRLFLALAATQAAPLDTGGSTELLTLGHTRRVYEDRLSRAHAVSATKRAAGLAGANARWHEHGTCMARAKQVPSAAIAAKSVRSESSGSALSLQRSSPSSAIQSAQSERSESGGDVIAIVGEGARAILQAKIGGWRRDQSLRMLQDAIARWRAAGVTTCPIQKASELAEGPYAEPARVQSLIEDADALLTEAKRTSRTVNPVGLLIVGLAQSERSRGRPSQIPIFVSQRWARAESDALRMLEAQAALSAKLAQARTVLQAADAAAGRA